MNLGDIDRYKLASDPDPAPSWLTGDNERDSDECIGCGVIADFELNNQPICSLCLSLCEVT